MRDPLGNLVKMANQIGTYFDSQSKDEPEVAARAIAAHLKSFWAPSMRSQLVGGIDSPEAAGLLPIVKLALAELAH